MKYAPKYKQPPLAPMNQWVRDALAHAEMTFAEAGRRLSGRKDLATSYDRSIVQRMTVGRKVSVAEAIALGEITGFSLPYSDDDLEFLQRRAKLTSRQKVKLEGFLEGLLSEADPGDNEGPTT